MQFSVQKNTQLLEIRDASLKRLTRFAGTRETDIQHFYLFRDEKFAGVRYRVGAFIASWFWGERVISIHRGASLIDQFPIDQFPIDSSVGKAA